MQKYFFWLSWDRPVSLLTSFLITILIGLILASFVLVIIEPEGLIGWHTFSQKESIDVIARTVDVGPFSFPFTEQLVIIKEFVAGGEILNYPMFKEIAMMAIIILLALVLALISYFNRFGFILFSTFIFFFIIFLHPEMLKLAEVNDYWILITIFLTFIAPAYYFQSFYKEASFGLRLMVLLLISAAFTTVVIIFSNVEAPLNLLFSYGILAPYLVVLLFVFMVGHEIVNAFILALASGKQQVGNNRIKHFLTLTIIYLLNVLIAYLQITHVINWNFVSINPIFLLGISGVLGVWGISQRFILYKNVSSSQQVWVLLYLTVAIITFTTIAYLLISVEDPLTKIISDFIIFTQLAFGLAFLVYVLYNFISIIEEGHSIKDILYKPQNLPHMTYRALGVAILTGLVLMRDINYPIWYSLGGYYNSIATYFEDIKDPKIASLFYEKGADLSKYNHKSNYKLGTFLIDEDREKAIHYFDVASSRLPTAQAFVNKSNLESNEGKYFEALFTLQKGISKLPKSVEISNNLGLQYNKANMLDSAWHYFSMAQGYTLSQNNALGFVLKNNFSVSKQDSSFLFDKLNKVGRINATALGYSVKLDSILLNTTMEADLVSNALVNDIIAYKLDGYESIAHLIDSIKNEVLAEQLNYAMAIYELRHEHISRGLERLQALSALGSENQLRYFELHGLINLQYGAYTRAEESFLLAGEFINANQQKTYLTALALAQSEAGYFTDAVATWQQVKMELKEDSVKAEVMIQVLNSILNNNDSTGSNDLNLYLKARYQRLWVDEFTVKTTLARIADAALRNHLAFELATYYFNAGNTDATKLFYDLIEVDNDLNEDLLGPLLKLNIRMAYHGLVPNLQQQVDKLHEAGFEYGASEQLEKLLFERSSKNLQPRELEMLATQNPFFAEGVVFAAQEYKTSEDGYKSYNVLQNALNKNPDNRLILEAYILEAINIGFEEYANNSLQHYRELFPGDLFYNFLQKVNRAKEAFNNRANEEA